MSFEIICDEITTKRNTNSKILWNNADNVKISCEIWLCSELKSNQITDFQHCMFLTKCFSKRMFLKFTFLIRKYEHVPRNRQGTRIHLKLIPRILNFHKETTTNWKKKHFLGVFDLNFFLLTWKESWNFPERRECESSHIFRNEP